MAEGYAQTSGKIGVAMVAAGAALANAIGPLLSAQASQTPLLLISGDSSIALDGRGAFQETPQTAMTSHATRSSCRLTDADQLQAQLHSLLALALSGQPGPVHLCIPSDVLEAQTHYRNGFDHPGNSASCKQFAPACDFDNGSYTSPVAGFAKECILALENAECPLILPGPGLRSTQSGLDLTQLKAPVLLIESPRGANDPALGKVKESWAQTDLVIALGKHIDYSLGFGNETLWPKARWICAYGDERACEQARSNLGSRLIDTRVCSPNDLARLLIEHDETLPARSDTLWQAKVATWTSQRTVGASLDNAITSADLVAAIQAVLQTLNNPILICDGGEFGQWAQTITGAPRRIINGLAGAIGGGIGHAIGAKAAAPESPVIAMMGDGTVGFHLSEFETAVRSRLPFVAIIGNDKRWNAEHLLQQRTYGSERTHGCELSDARYDQVAEALGGFGAYVTNIDQIDIAMHEALRCNRPACINVVIEGLGAPCH